MTMLGLHNLKIAAGSKKGKIRRGRGSASGKGNQSGRGAKGQRARSGGKSGLNLFGVRNYLLRIPKNRGFKSLYEHPETVNLEDLENNFKAGQTVTPRELLNKKLIKTVNNGVKVLGAGKLTKKLDVWANGFSKNAKTAIIKAGGKANVYSQKAKKTNK